MSRANAPSREYARDERAEKQRKMQRVLTPDESNRAARIALVTRRAIEAFGDKAQAHEWLTRPNRPFRGFAPVDLLASDAGTALVTDELGRIEHGELY